jgi:uncharacterized protein GlcG (DUF336 family)
MSLALTKLSIRSAAATRILTHAEQTATALGVAVVIAVTDEAGVIKGLCRMDGAPLISIDIAQDKAYTAASFGVPTHEWHDRIKDEPALLHGLLKAPRFTILGGGVPIVQDGALIGGLGVSGGSAEQDLRIAQAALDLARTGA